MIDICLIFLGLVLGLRTLSLHLQSWQLREYRLDRMRAWLKTNDGINFKRNFWFFKGLFPRPKLSLRIFLIMGMVVLLSLLLWEIKTLYLPNIPSWVWTFVWERSLWFQVFIGVWVSEFPVKYKQKQLFTAAKKVIDQAPEITRIGITGSYGKSSTKELLVHLLRSHFGTENVLFNPANNNSEVAIARLILAHKDFFKQSQKPRFFVCEVGAYAQGEIKSVCDFLQPQQSIITAVSAQHLDLFGSVQSIGNAKFEMAEATTQKVFFNADSPDLALRFQDPNIKALSVAISTKNLKIQSRAESTNFHAFKQDFHLPWPGEFFVTNSMLALEVARELGIKPIQSSKYLRQIAPLERALNIKSHPQGYTILEDLYSANQEGVLAAIRHLGHFPGQRVFVGMPLRELGEKEIEVHTQIFKALKAIEATVFWCKSDFSNLGRSILGTNFQGIEKNTEILKTTIKKLTIHDALLLESKLPQSVLACISS